MSARSMTLAVLAGAALAACVPMPPRGPTDLAAWTRCNTAGPGNRCDVQVVRDDAGPYACALGRFRVIPDALELTGGRPVNLQWEVPRGFGFCDGDGVRLKAGYEFGQEFLWETFASDDKDGNRKAIEAASACRQFTNWRWGNGNSGSTYAYMIRFRDPGTGRTCTIDPFIRNG